MVLLLINPMAWLDPLDILGNQENRHASSTERRRQNQGQGQTNISGRWNSGSSGRQGELDATSGMHPGNRQGHPTADD